jgi:hypothetical protein
VGLKLIFLIASRAVSLLSLSRREAWWKDAEILMLRRQLAVALRERRRAAGAGVLLPPGQQLLVQTQRSRPPWASDSSIV